MVRRPQRQYQPTTLPVMMRVILLLGAAAVCLARPDLLEDHLGLFSLEEIDLSVRAVPNPKTPNQILDVIAENAAEKIRSAGWDSSKKVQNGHSTIPFDVNSGGASSSEEFAITGASISGLDSLRRSKSASFNSDKSQLKGTLMVENACATADYIVTFSGVGEAPSQKVNGKVTECVDKLFADVEVRLSDLVPQNIKSYSVRSGHDSLAISNMGGNNMADVHEAGIRKSLRQHLEKTMASNVKVKVNQAIQDLKAAAQSV